MANSDLLPKDVVVNIHDEVSKKVAVSTPGDFLKKGVAKTWGEAFKKMEVSTLSKITTTKGQLNLSKKVAENPQGDAAKQIRYSDRLVVLEGKLCIELDIVLFLEENLWGKKRTQWILHRDRNTWFYDAFTMMHQHSNTILELLDESENVCNDQDQLMDITISFFQNLFPSSGIDG
ncbi:hypothetical protein V6N13_037629 [Hibiscus sabdariffa]